MMMWTALLVGLIILGNGLGGVPELSVRTVGSNRVEGPNSQVSVLIEGTYQAEEAGKGFIRVYIYFFHIIGSKEEILAGLEKMEIERPSGTRTYYKPNIANKLFWEYEFALSIVDIVLENPTVAGETIKIRMEGKFRAEKIATVEIGPPAKINTKEGPAVVFQTTITAAYYIKIERGTLEINVSGDLARVLDILNAKSTGELRAYINETPVPVSSEGVFYSLPEMQSGQVERVNVKIVKVAGPPAPKEIPYQAIFIILVVLLVAVLLIRVKKKRSKKEEEMFPLEKEEEQKKKLEKKEEKKAEEEWEYVEGESKMY